MANRLFQSQFSYSFERQPVRLMGAFTQSGSTGTFATVTTQGVTLTAVTMGSAGNSITIAFTGGGTAGSEVVTVTGTAISVQIQSGVSTITQVRTAINAAPAAAALVTATGTSSSTVATASAVPLATGTDTVFTSNCKLTPMTLTQIGTGKFQIALAQSYASLLSASLSLQKTTATDAMTQIVSSDVKSAQTVVFRTVAAGSATDLVDTDKIFICLDLRNSGNSTN